MYDGQKVREKDVIRFSLRRQKGSTRLLYLTRSRKCRTLWTENIQRHYLGQNGKQNFFNLNC